MSRADLVLTRVIRLLSLVIFVSAQAALDGQCVVGGNTLSSELHIFTNNAAELFRMLVV
ncbi:MAG: hypothetical protein JJD98_13920 [Polaromonas sp.]|nr:hypothetical protein [Polaromonas sp.]